MAEEKSQRLDDALASLVDILVPPRADEDEAGLDERHEEALDLARDILDENHDSPHGYDVQQVASLIKKKLIRDGKPREKVEKFSSLHTKLLEQPVLSKKWEILYLLQKMSNSDRKEARSQAQSNGYREHRSREATGSQQRLELDDQTLRDAFAPSGPPQLPHDRHASGSSSRPRTARSAEESMGRNTRNQKTRHDDSDYEATKFKQDPVLESTILRDLPFTLQGLSTKNLPFTSQNTLELPPSLSLPLISILHTLAEPALLYRTLSEFVKSRGEGLIEQSLRSAMANELRAYLELISTIESKIRYALSSNQKTEHHDNDPTVSVTLKRCVIWTREPTMNLRLMSLIVEEAKTRKGGQLISMIHSFSTSHGDPFVSDFAERMLTHVTQPCYDMIRKWIYDGELSDPYNEFFVSENSTHQDSEDSRRGAATSVWEEKYKLDQTMIPSIITEAFARKVFLIGKSLNFIRYSCEESGWVEKYSKEASKELHYGDTATLESSIDQAYKTTMARLTHLMDTKFHLFDHLNALKRYLLLGQGDFIALLMESLATNLDRPAGSQYRHTLTAQLEHAIRGSNAQFDSPATLRRLDARLTEMEKGDTGWDVFTLEYKVDAPVDVIITQWANRQYLKIFNLLWRVKRVEFALGSTWRRCMTGARGVLAPADARTAHDWKSARCVIAEMIHFVNQLQYYILFEVIEASWDTLHATISKPECTLDDLITAHTKYLKAITHKGLLGSVRTNTSGHREDVFTVQLHEILKTMLSYKEAVDGLYSFSVAAFTRNQEVAAIAQTRDKRTMLGKDDPDLDSPYSLSGHTGVDTGRDTESPFPIAPSLRNLPSDEDSILPALRTRLTSLSSDFKTRISTLLGDLATQPDVDMRFLGVVMNFNNVYQPKKRRRPQHHQPSNPATATAVKKTPAPQISKA